MKTQLQNQDEPKCSKCEGSYFEMNEQGATFCANCGLVLQQFNFDNNVAFGAQREMLGKNINAQGTLHLIQKNKISFQVRGD